LVKNPLVKETADQTLDQIINRLNYVSASLDKMGDDDEAAYMSAAQATGLRDIIDGLQNATEICVGQCLQRGDC
jgi:formiminotetrahydrofolate cyclodeaminase